MKDRNKEFYRYQFSNGESHVMTPTEAHKYTHKHKIDIWEGPGYIERKKEKSFDGFGWHDSLLMSFRGPAHYRAYLKEHNMVEVDANDCPVEQKYNKPIWDEELIRKCINQYGIQIDSILAEALMRGELDYPDQAGY